MTRKFYSMLLKSAGLTVSLFAIVLMISAFQSGDVKGNEYYMIQVTNNPTSTDKPAISTKPDGSGAFTLSLNSSITFKIKASDPHLYLWTCNPTCAWRAFDVPMEKGKSIDYNVDDPVHRQLTFTRIK